MNTNRSVEELLKLVKVQNISQLGSDVIRELFNNISVKEVMKLCRVSKQFNIVCETKSETRLWNNKDVRFESNMINLNAHWVNGKHTENYLKRD